MANLTLSIADALKLEMERYNEVRWSEVAKKAIVHKLEQMHKLEILRKYVEKEPFSAEDLKWMDENDWHPVDEKQLKKDFIKSVQTSSKSSPRKVSLKELLG
ncbi:MAG: hypothetical protein V1822_03020 [Candidatus Micrarchaeota archaeon]